MSALLPCTHSKPRPLRSLIIGEIRYDCQQQSSIIEAIRKESQADVGDPGQGHAVAADDGDQIGDEGAD